MQWQSYAYLYSAWSQFVSSTPPIGTSANATVDAVNVYVLNYPSEMRKTNRAFLSYRMLGNGGDTPNGSGGMIPSVAPPFGMTDWVA